MSNQRTQEEGSNTQTTIVRQFGSLERVMARQEAEARAHMYHFLAAIYLHPPSRDLLELVLDRAFLSELPFLFGVRTVAELRRFSATARPDQEMATLRQEYMDLFVVPSGRYTTPFEDVYRGRVAGREGKSRSGPLMGEWAISAKRLYREAGAQMDLACKELPNHIGVELSFMGFLCEREAAPTEDDASLSRSQSAQLDSERSLGLQIRFLQEHLNQWFPQLSALIQAKTKSRFYRWAAQITEEFLALDTAALLARSRAAKNLSNQEGLE